MNGKCQAAQTNRPMSQRWKRSFACLLHLLQGSRWAAVCCIAICVGAPGVVAAIQPSFAPSQTLPMPSHPRAIAIADLDADGRKDLVLATRFYFDPANDYKLFVFFQNPDGTLAAPLKLDGGNGNSVAVGDVNGDGLPDLVTTFDDGIGVRYGLGGRQFGPMVKFPTASPMDLVQVADLSSDVRQDIVAIDWASANMAVFYQIRGGNLAPAAYVPAPHGGWNDLKVADMNRDGRLDVVISSMQAAPGTQTVILLQRADGTFDAPRLPGYIFGPFAPQGIGLVDIDGDGATDIVATQAWNTPEARLILLFNRGLSFSTTELVSSYDSPQPVQIGDVDLDGLPDVIVAHGGWLRAGVYTRRASGGLDPEVLFEIPYYDFGPQGLATGDLNGDGRPDLVFAGPDGLTILYNTTPFPPTPTSTAIPVFTPWGLLTLVLAMAGAFRVAMRLRE